MAQWQLRFWVDVGRVGKCTQREDLAASDANAILRAISRVEPRPTRAVYDDGKVQASFIIDAESLSEAHGQQARIHDSLSDVIDKADTHNRYAVEFDPPQEVEAGTKGR